MGAGMDGHIRKMRPWRHPHPKISWAMAALAVLTGLLPFLSGMIVVAFKTALSSLDAASYGSAITSAALYTIKQASLSTLVVAAGAPVFATGLVFAKPWVLRFSTLIRTLIFCLPSLVVATGMILAWGNNGVATRFLESIGIFAPFSRIVYSPYALVFANSLMNLPFASLMIFRALTEIPAEQIDSATLLGLRPLTAYRRVFWPAIQPVLVYFCGITFLLSLGSFGALSILGGGPASQTLEMGIYQSIYVDSDWTAGAFFAAAHTAIAGLVAIIFIVPQYRWLNAFLSQQPSSKPNLNKLARLIADLPVARWLMLAATFGLDFCVLIPILAVLQNTFHFLVTGTALDWSELRTLLESLKVSLGYAVPAATISTTTAWLICRSFCRYKQFQRPKFAITMLLGALSAGVVPVMAAAFGLLVLRSLLPEGIMGSPAIVALHATMMLPFLVNIILPIYSRKIMPFESSRILMGLSDFRWLTQLEWPTVYKTLASAFAVALSLSLNETAIVSMLGDPAQPALTTTMIRLMGHYRFGESAIGSCILIFVSLITISLISRRRESIDDAA
jgi:thiamine transport system permease protein